MYPGHLYIEYQDCTQKKKEGNIRQKVKTISRKIKVRCNIKQDQNMTIIELNKTCGITKIIKEKKDVC